MKYGFAVNKTGDLMIRRFYSLNELWDRLRRGGWEEDEI